MSSRSSSKERSAHVLDETKAHPVPAATGQTLSAETLLYTLSESNIRKDIEEELNLDRDTATGDHTSPRSRKSTPIALHASVRGVDGGYGWVVILGSFMSHMLEGGFERGDGIFYMHFLQEFGQSHQQTALVGAMASTLRSLLSPLASTVCNRYSVRASVMFGAGVFASAVFLTQFASSLYVLYFTFSVLTGVGRAFIGGPSLIVIGLYFRRRQGIASGMSVAGVGVGAFLLVPLEQYLFDQYGFQGAFLILSAVASHMLLVGMLYRPLSTNNLYLAQDAHKRIQRTLARREEKEQENSNVDTHVILDRFKQDMERARGVSLGSESMALPFKVTRSGRLVIPMINRKGVPPQSNLFGKWKSAACDNCCCAICFPVEEFNLYPSADAKSDHIFQCFLLRYKAFFFYCFATFLLTGAVKVAYVFLPTLVQAKGHSLHDAALILSVAGPIDTISRICVGLVLDLTSLRSYRLRVFSGALFCTAVSTVTIPVASSLRLVMVAMTVYSVSAGICFATRIVVLMDLMGVHLFSNAFGVVMFFQGFGTLLGPPLAGYLLDVYGTVTYIYYMAAALTATAAFCMTRSAAAVSVS